MANTATQTPVAAGLSAEAQASFQKSGASIARSTAQRSLLIAELGELLKPCTTFALWEAARVEFIAGARGAGFAAPEALWQEIVRAGQALGLVGDKPKSTDPEATKKHAQRASKADKVAEAIKAGTTAMDLVAEAKKASEAGDVSKAIEALALSKAIQEKVTKDASKKAAEACADLAKKARDCINAATKAGDVEALRRMVNAYAKPAPKAGKAKA